MYHFNFKPGLYTVLIVAMGICTANGQFLSYMDTVASYSLINTAADQTGSYPDIELSNTPFADTNGIYCNGLYIFDVMPGGSAAITESLEELYDPAFAASVEFNLDTSRTRTSPILVLGEGWRYLGIIAQPDGSVYCLFNGAQYQVQDYSISGNAWHRAAVMYTEVDSTAQFWIDGKLIMVREGLLNRDVNDGQVSNTHYGNGLTFHGFLRNLTVWSSEDLLSDITTVNSTKNIRLYPNPTSDFVHFSGNERFTWEIYSASGSQVMKGINEPDQSIDVSGLPDGIYYFSSTNSETQTQFVRQFVKGSSQ